MTLKLPSLKAVFGTLAFTAAVAAPAYMMGQHSNAADIAEEAALKTSRLCPNPIIPSSFDHDLGMKNDDVHPRFRADDERRKVALLDGVWKRLKSGEKVTVQLSPPNETAYIPLMTGDTYQYSCYTIR